MSNNFLMKLRTEWTHTMSSRVVLCALFLAPFVPNPAIAHSDTAISLGDFVHNLILSTANDGRFDFETKFACGSEDSEKIVACLDVESGIEFRYKHEPMLDSVSIDIIITTSSAVSPTNAPRDGQISIRDEGEFASLRKQFSQVQRAFELDGAECDLQLDRPQSTSDHTQSFSLRNPVSDNAIVLLFPDSGFEESGVAGFGMDEKGERLIGSIIIANALATPCDGAD